MASGIQGTEAFRAPELWRYAEAGRPLTTLDYQTADIWALGETTFQMMTLQRTFNSREDFASFEAGEVAFPSNILDIHGVTREGQEFIKHLMRVQPWRRPTASQAIFDDWIKTANPNSPEGEHSDARRYAVILRTAKNTLSDSFK
jgi:serine/threonine protein kinase